MANTPSPEKVKAQAIDSPRFENALAARLESLRMKKEGGEGTGELEQKIKKAASYLEKWDRPLEQPRTVRKTLQEWDRLNNILRYLERNKPDQQYVALVQMLDSNLSEFLDDGVLGQATLAREQIVFGNSVRQATNKDPTFEELEAQERQAEDKTRPSEDPRGRPRKKPIEKKKRDVFEDKIPPETILSFISLTREAQAMLQNRLAERLEKKLKEAERQTESFIRKWKSNLSPETAEDLRTRLKGAGRFVDGQIRHFDPLRMKPSEALSRLEDNCSDFEQELNGSLQYLEEWGAKLEAYARDPEKIRQKVDRRERRLKNLMTPETQKALQGALDLEKQRKGADEGFVEATERFLKRLEKDQEGVLDPDNLPRLKGRPAEEIIQRDAELGMFAGKIESAEKAGRAREALKALGTAGTLADMLEALKDKVGEEHLEYVPSKVFEKKYRRYTSAGSMVFYERGEEWKIIVDESKVGQGGPEEIDFLRNELTHELRHAEFEGDARLHESWERAFLGHLSTSDWQRIKADFVKSDPDKSPPDSKKKKPFSPDDWKDEDVLSELYAMRREPTPALPAVEALIAKGERLARFDFSDELRRQWAQTLLSETEEGQQRWVALRTQLQAAFPERVDAEGKTVAEWESPQVLAELYALSQSADLESHPVLAAALADTGLAGLLEEKAAAAQDYPEAVETRATIRGSAGGKGGHAKEDAESEGGHDASKEGLLHKLEELLHHAHTFEESPYLNDIPGGHAFLKTIVRYAEDLEGRLDDLEATGNLEKAEKFIEVLEEDLDTGDDSLKEKLKIISEASKNTEAGPLASLWKNTYIYSLKDFAAVYEHGKDYLERWLKRGAGIRKGNLSKAFFEGVNEGLALESSSFISGAWKEAIQGWEERFKSKDTSKLKTYMADQAKLAFPDKAVVCAIINVLCEEKGDMDWHDPNLWICLNKLQPETRLDPNDHLLHTDKNYLHAKLKKALATPQIFNKQAAFNDRDRKNTHTFESRKHEYQAVVAENQDTIPSELVRLLATALKDKKSDKPTNVDAAKYDELLDSSIKNGWCYPEAIMFHLISGMGIGLLHANAGSRLAQHFGAYPIMDYFNAMAKEWHTPHDIEAFCKKHFPKDFASGKITPPDSDFMKFYWTQMTNDTRKVHTRMISKTVPGGEPFDHDWARAFAFCGDASVPKKYLKGPSASPTTKGTMPPNAYAGYLQWFEQNGHAHPSKDILIHRIGSYFMFEAILSGAAYPTEKSYFRGSSLDKTVPPREAGLTRHPTMSLGGIESSLNAMMGSLPRLGALFQYAIDNRAASNPTQHLAELRRLLGEALPAGQQGWIQMNINKPDDFYDNIGNIVRWALEGVSEADLLSTIQKKVG